MNENRNQDRHPLPQESARHADEWSRDLNPDRLAGQNIGVQSDTATRGRRTAFHLRKQGHELNNLDDTDLKQIPVLDEGTRLQQGATYVDLLGDVSREFKATGDVVADASHAYVPKDRVPYEVWNRLIGEPKPGQQ